MIHYAYSLTTKSKGGKKVVETIIYILFFGIVAFEFGRRVGMHDGQLDCPRQTKKINFGLRIAVWLILFPLFTIIFPFGLFYIGNKIGYKVGQAHYYDFRIRENLSISPTRSYHTV
jgi:hypothetical protein